MKSNTYLILGMMIAAMLASGGCGQGTTKEPPTLHLHLPADGTIVFGSRVIDRIELRRQADLFVSENGNAVNPVLHLDKSLPQAKLLDVVSALQAHNFRDMTLSWKDDAGENRTFVLASPSHHSRPVHVLFAGVSNRVYWTHSRVSRELVEIEDKIDQQIVDGSELRERITALKTLEGSRLLLWVRNDDDTLEGMLDLIDAARAGGFSEAVLCVEGR